MYGSGGTSIPRAFDKNRLFRNRVAFSRRFGTSSQSASM
jgi:hypothetical protein